MTLKIIVFILSAIIAIGGLYLTEPNRPKLAMFLSFLIIISVIVGIALESKDNRSKKQQHDYVRELLENLVTNQYEKDLQSKYPGGYALFGIDHSRTFENRSIPHRSSVLEEYEFDWSPVEISEVTETNVTIEFPNIQYKPLNGNLFSTAMTIPKSPK